MVKPVQSRNLRLPFRIGLGIAVCAFPFTLPPLKHSVTAKLLGPPLEQPVSTSTFVEEMHKQHLNKFAIWFCIARLKLPPQNLSQDFCDSNVEIIDKLQDYEKDGFTNADRGFARNPLNFNNELTIAIVGNKDYVIEEEDVNIAELKKNTFFAGAAASNPTFPIKWEHIKMYLESKERNIFLLGLGFNKRLKEAFAQHKVEYEKWKLNRKEESTPEERLLTADISSLP